METYEILARHHRRVVDEFIESELDELDLTDLERNLMAVIIRREVEVGLVPGLTAVQAVFHAADADVLNHMPEWLDSVSSVIPEESSFLSEMGRRLDPGEIAFLDENLGMGPGESQVRRSFDTHLWDMAPVVKRSERRDLSRKGDWS